MDMLTIFGTQLVLSLFVYTLVAKWYLVPWLAEKPVEQVLIALIFPHALRHIGLSFFVSGVAGENLPSSFAYAAAYGDFIAGLLAILCLFALRNAWALTLPLVWVFNVVGSIDLLNALRQAEVVPYLGTTWFIPTFFVPMLLVTHVMIFSRLLGLSRQQLRVATSGVSTT
jgi:hypothetical protein